MEGFEIELFQAPVALWRKQRSHREQVWGGGTLAHPPPFQQRISTFIHFKYWNLVSIRKHY